MKPDRLLRFLRAHFRACLLPALLTSQATAQTFTWDGGGGDDFFGTNTNWAGDTSPSTGSGVKLEFTGSTRPTPDNNYSTGDNFGEWHLLSGAGSDFTITGNGFGLYGKIENDSGSGHDLTVNTAGIYARDGSIEFNPVGGDLTIGALVTLDDNAALNVYDGNNGNTLTLNGVLSGGNGNGGNGSLVLNQTANVILANDNTYGGTVINNGTTLQVGTGGTTGSLGVGNTANDGSLIFNRSNAYTYSGILSGSGTLAKLGAGTLTLSGTNTHTGKTTVSGGILSIASDANLGTAPGSATADQLTLDGGTLVITGATTLNANRGITIGSSGGTIDTSGLGTGTGFQVIIASNLTGSNGLTVNAHGNLSASGGSSNSYLQFGGDNNGLSGGIAITGGLVDVLTDNALGSNQITLSNAGGIVNANHGTRSLANDIVISTGGGTLRNWGSATTNYSGSISGSTFINRTDGGTINLTGDLSGFDGAFNHQAGTTRFQTGANALDGTLTLSAGEVSIENTATNNYSAVNLNGGTLRVKSNNNALGSATLAVGGNATFASQIGSSALTFTNDATIAGTSTLSVDAGYAAITWNGNITGTGTKVRTSSSGTLTIGGTVNMGSTSTGNVSVESNGTMNLASTAVVTAGNVFNNNNAGTLNINGATVDTGTLSLTSNGSINLNAGTLTAAEVALTNQTGTLNIAGGTLNTQYFNIGNASNNSGRVVQTGGTVNVNSGGTGFRIGHWNNGGNAGSVYNISGGVLDATALSENSDSARYVNIGWDGQGDMVVGGGASSATLKAFGIQLDANVNGGGSTGGNMTLSILANGQVQVGAGGIGAGSTSDLTIIDGGTLRATASASWNGGVTVNSGGATIEVDSGATLTRNGAFSGAYILEKTGVGTLKFQSYGGSSFSGSIVASEGTVQFSGSLFNGTTGLTSVTIEDSATLLISSAHALGGYYAATPTVTVESGGTLTLNSENYLSVMDLTGATVNGTSEVRSDSGFAATVHADANPTVWSARLNLVNKRADFTVDDGAEIQINGNISGSPGLDKKGDGLMVLSGTNGYGGTTSVAEGTLLVNGSHTGTGDVNVATGATLGGTGSLVAAVNVTGSLSPGASIESLSMGSLSLLDGSTLVYEASNGDSNLGDLLAIDGDFNLTGLVNLDLSGADLSDSGWALGSKLSIASYTGSWNNGTFDGFANTSSHTFGINEWEIRYDDTTPGSNFTGEQAGSYVTLTLVPEPTSAMFALISITGLLFRRRR